MREYFHSVCWLDINAAHIYGLYTCLWCANILCCCLFAYPFKIAADGDLKRGRTRAARKSPDPYELYLLILSCITAACPATSWPIMYSLYVYTQIPSPITAAAEYTVLLLLVIELEREPRDDAIQRCASCNNNAIEWEKENRFCCVCITSTQINNSSRRMSLSLRAGTSWNQISNKFVYLLLLLFSFLIRISNGCCCCCSTRCFHLHNTPSTSLRQRPIAIEQCAPFHGRGIKKHTTLSVLQSTAATRTISTGCCTSSIVIEWTCRFIIIDCRASRFLAVATVRQIYYFQSK